MGLNLSTTLVNHAGSVMKPKQQMPTPRCAVRAMLPHFGAINTEISANPMSCLLLIDI